MKKLIISIICLFSFFIVGNVSAAQVCTDEQIKAARGVLDVDALAYVPIPSLGRLYNVDNKQNHSYIYKMTLTIGNEEFTSLCLDNGKTAIDGRVYKININKDGTFHKIDTSEWKKLYQYATENRDNDLQFILAQAALWILRTRLTNKAIPYNEKNIYAVTKDIIINKNCEIYLGMYKPAHIAKTFCDSAKKQDNSTDIIEAEINRLYESSQKGDQFVSFGGPLEVVYAQINSEAEKLINYTNEYPNDLYYWVEATGADHQAMLAPLGCGGSTEKYCIDSNGTKKVYTDEYNNCVVNGGTAAACKASMDKKHCPNTTYQYGIVKTTGSDAVCNNTDENNSGVYNEYVDYSQPGLASSYGNPINQIQISPYCNLYCKEISSTQNFPGNIGEAQSVGTFVIWPTSEATRSSKFGNMYPLKFEGQKECYVDMSPNSINNIDINAILQNKINTAKNANGSVSYAVNTKFDDLRVGIGCDGAYGVETGNGHTSGYCKSKYDDLEAAKSDLSTFENEYNDYDRYLEKTKEIDDYNSCLTNASSSDTCKNASSTCSNKDTVCNEANSSGVCSFCDSSCQGKSSPKCIEYCKKCETAKTACTTAQTACNTAKTACDNYCGAEPEYSKEELDGKAEYDRLSNEVTSAQTAYDNCNTERNSCNTYVGKVNDIIEMVNQVRVCGEYKPQCSGDSCDIYNYLTNIDVSWGDPQYGGTIISDSQLEKKQTYSTEISTNPTIDSIDSSKKISDIEQQSYNILTQVDSAVTNRSIIATSTVTYSLPTVNKIYNYVVTLSNGGILVLDKLPNGNYSEAVEIGYSNLPISFDAIPGQKYDLIISNIRHGDNGQYYPSTYKCNYTVTSKTDSEPCLCPAGTKREGASLEGEMRTDGISCEVAKEKYCDGPIVIQYCTLEDGTQKDISHCETAPDYYECYDAACPTGPDPPYYCVNESTGLKINITVCLSGYDYNYCYKRFCKGPGPESHYYCKNPYTNNDIEITSCVIAEMSKGMSDSDAKTSCTEKTPDCNIPPPSGGLNIIYRTISLENPFPSYNSDLTVTQTGLIKGMFNDDVKGRYPGTNWNNVNLVKNHILTVERQGVKYDGSDIYQGQPLYVFELNTTTINAIRKYNEQNEYTDFKLDCKKNNSRACVSDFVHNASLSGLTGGVCSNSIRANDFYTCSGDA